MAAPSTLGVWGNAAVGSFPWGGSLDPLVQGLFLFLDGADLIVVGRLKSGTLEIKDKLGGPKQLEFVDRTPSGDPLVLGQKLEVRFDGVRVFLGSIDQIRREVVPTGTGRFTRVEALDLAGMMERRLTTAKVTYTNQTSKSIILSLVSNYLGGEVLTTNSVQTGPTIAEFTQEAFKSVAEVLRDLSDLTGFIWFVDSNGDLNWIPQTHVAAPYALGNADGIGVRRPLEDVKVSESLAQYRNRQTVVYAGDASVTVNDTAEQTARAAIEGGSGIYHAVHKDSEITTAAEATALADALLRRFGDIPTKVSFAIRAPGLQAGQELSIDLREPGARDRRLLEDGSGLRLLEDGSGRRLLETPIWIKGDFLIDQVIIRDIETQLLEYEAQAVSGEHLEDENAFWRLALGKG